MSRARGAHKTVVLNGQLLPQVVKLRRNVITKLLDLRDLTGAAARLGRRRGDLFAVLIAPGHEERLRSGHAIEPRQGIGGDRGIGGAHVRRGIDIVQRGGDDTAASAERGWIGGGPNRGPRSAGYADVKWGRVRRQAAGGKSLVSQNASRHDGGHKTKVHEARYGQGLLRVGSRENWGFG
ncbi:unnamed protein product [Chondrus crispus]|uniref:Uncharacterized protein n=1 Tax=Chondrus crispus TaxID=2769 RepID=R7QRN1_CHOCR|nr:unnamed protein product [Chondrus crispus]CDF40156.1 unnamed protein product [Chondrus crispus]|eukprot:XP_005710450.1 unnamed protein product [Chondrus crispus]